MSRSGYAPGDPGTVLDAPTAKAISDTLMRRFGYDAGSVGAYTIDANSTKLFGRLDINLSDVHKLNIRHNFVNADAGQLSRAPTAVNWGSQDFVQKSMNNSTVAELKSTFGSGAGNDLIAGLTITHDQRDPIGTIFPQLEITGPSGSALFVGTNREAAVFKINTSILELTDNLTLYRGRHTVTLGSHNEIYGVQYTFQNAWNGRWQYGSIANFFADKPSRIRGTYSLGDNSYATVSNTPVADFKVYWPSAYAQDEVAVTDRLHVTAGVRVDVPLFDKAPINQQFVGTTYNGTQPFAKYTNNYGKQILCCPASLVQLGRERRPVIPASRRFRHLCRTRSVFMAGVHVLQRWRKVRQYRLSSEHHVRCAGNSATVPLVSDPTNLKSIQAGVYEMNVIDNDFKMPTMWRSSLASDFKLPDGTKVTLEGTYTKTINDVKFLNIGLKDSTAAAPVDGRPIFLGNP